MMILDTFNLRLAQVESVSFTQVGTAVALLVVGVGLVWMVLGIVKSLRPSPAHSELYATKEALQRVSDDVGDVSDDVEHFRDELRQKFASMETSGKMSRAEIYKQIREVSESMAAVGEQSKLSYQFMLRLDAKLDRLIEKKDI